MASHDLHVATPIRNWTTLVERISQPETKRTNCRIRRQIHIAIALYFRLVLDAKKGNTVRSLLIVGLFLILPAPNLVAQTAEFNLRHELVDSHTLEHAYGKERRKKCFYEYKGEKYIDSRPIHEKCPRKLNVVPREWHVVLGGEESWPADSTDVLLDVEVNNLRARLVRRASSRCADGSEDHVEIAGAIDVDTPVVVERLLNAAQQCRTTDGAQAGVVLYMNSYGGKLADGYKIGQLLRERVVAAKVGSGQVCASACAVAFIGAKSRTVRGSGQLIFHAPYVRRAGKLDCSDEHEITVLKTYFRQMLGEADGDLLHSRTMNYCTPSDGWTLNADAARLFGIVR